MKYNEFIKVQENALAGYHLLSKMFPGRFEIETPYPPAELSEEELDELKRCLNECMPSNSMIMDLWYWNIHFEEDLGDDWYFEVAFGSLKSNIDHCVDELASFFMEKVIEYDLDYNQINDSAEFNEMVRKKAHEFIIAWRGKIIDRFVNEDCPIIIIRQVVLP
jgi:hypothetical protein